MANHRKEQIELTVESDLEGSDVDSGDERAGRGHKKKRKRRKAKRRETEGGDDGIGIEEDGQDSESSESEEDIRSKFRRMVRKVRTGNLLTLEKRMRRRQALAADIFRGGVLYQPHPHPHPHLHRATSIGHAHPHHGRGAGAGMMSLYNRQPSLSVRWRGLRGTLVIKVIKARNLRISDPVVRGWKHTRWEKALAEREQGLKALTAGAANGNGKDLTAAERKKLLADGKIDELDEANRLESSRKRAERAFADAEAESARPHPVLARFEGTSDPYVVVKVKDTGIAYRAARASRWNLGLSAFGGAFGLDDAEEDDLLAAVGVRAEDVNQRAGGDAEQAAEKALAAIRAMVSS